LSGFELPVVPGYRVLVAGLGNELLMDDGVGIHVIRLMHSCVSGSVLLAEIGTAVLDALHLLEWADFVICIDAVQANHPPGTVYHFEIGKAGKQGQLVSLHEMGIVGALRFVPEHLQPQEIMVVGVEPCVIDYGLELSQPVQDALPRAAEAVKSLIEGYRMWECGIS
jgi:hydrogenase maturation protease